MVNTYNDVRIRIEVVVVCGAVDLLDIDIHASVVGPVVRERDDEPDAVRLGGGYDGVEARDTVAARVECRYPVRPELVVSAVGLRRSHVVETPIIRCKFRMSLIAPRNRNWLGVARLPRADGGEPRVLDVVEGRVDVRIRVLCEPVRVRTSNDIICAVEGELLSVRFDKASR